MPASENEALKSGRKIAEHLAKILPPEKTILIDAFAGAGGNSIAFALSGRFDRIFAIEKDPEVIKCAKHNAEIYGVKNKIWFVKGDCFDVLPKQYKKLGKDAVIFASPPWGGNFSRIL
jgi:trimethylguanosine synthase